MKNITVKLQYLTPMEAAIGAVRKPYMNEKADENLLEKIIVRIGHQSVAEHIVMNWDIDGVSRLELQEHMRHRIASPTVQSTRFALNKIIKGGKLFKDLCVMPDLSLPQFDNLTTEEKKLFEVELMYHVNDTMDRVQKMKELGYSNDLVKYFLPECLRTSISWTINLRSMFNFISLRTDKKAHFEIRYVANMMLKELNKTWVKSLLTQFSENNDE